MHFAAYVGRTIRSRFKQIVGIQNLDHSSISMNAPLSVRSPNKPRSRLSRPRDGEDRRAGGGAAAVDRTAERETPGRHLPRRHQRPEPARSHEALRHRMARRVPAHWELKRLEVRRFRLRAVGTPTYQADLAVLGCGRPMCVQPRTSREQMDLADLGRSHRRNERFSRRRGLARGSRQRASLCSSWHDPVAYVTCDQNAGSMAVDRDLKAALLACV